MFRVPNLLHKNGVPSKRTGLLYNDLRLIHGLSPANDRSGAKIENERERNNDIGGSLLVLSPSLWPQPNSSAAGVRTVSLLSYFADPTTSLFRSVHFGSGAKPTKPPFKNQCRGVALQNIPPNRSKIIQDFLTSDDMADLSAVIFDRFFAEEAYSFHFHQHKPNVVRILDMQDMHSLRTCRKIIVDAHDDQYETYGMPPGFFDKLMEISPSATSLNFGRVLGNNFTPKLQTQSNNDKILRELASIHRSDLTLVCSPYELHLLRDKYKINPSKLVLAPFFTEEISEFYDSHQYSFKSRRNFVTLGGFKHPPNVDSVYVLKREIWPKIRLTNPDAQLHVYGAFPPQHISNLHDEKLGFIIKGYVENLDETLGTYRVLLAPLRFGAGIKGKIVDGWRCGLPVVTTPMGSEGMSVKEDDRWGGCIASDSEQFINYSSTLYNDRRLWQQCQSSARKLLKELYDKKRNLEIVNSAIERTIIEKQQQRAEDYPSALLWHHSMRSSEYFSRWIELKETNNIPNDSSNPKTTP